jgi:4-amino-4-deoxy-L-arabinose transferase-like glycosyltransferase
MDGLKKGRVAFSARADIWLKSIFKIAIWVILAAGFLALFYSSFYGKTGLYVYEPDAMDYGQIARHNLKGEWFQTSFIRPVSLWVTDCSDGVPDLANPPLYSVYLMPIISIFGATDKALIIGSAALHLVILLVVFLFTRAAFNKTVAYYSMFFYLSCSVVLMAAFSGLPQMLAGLLITLLMAVLYFCEDSKWWLGIVAGLLCGLCFLTTYSYGLFALPVLLYLIFTLKKKRIVGSLAFLVVFILVISPWLLRNSSLTGNPFFTLRSYRPHQMAQMNAAPGSRQPYVFGQYSFLRSVSPQVATSKIPSLEVNKNILRQLRSNYLNIFNDTTRNLLIVFFLAGIFYRYRNKRIDRVRFVFYAFIFLEFIALSMMAPDSMKLVPFAPFIIIMGTAFFISCIERVRPKYFIARLGIIAVFIVANLYITIAIIKPNDQAVQQSGGNIFKGLAAETVTAIAQEDEAILTNIPWAVAWYSRMEAIWFPPIYRDINRINSIRPFSLVFYSPRMLAPHQDQSWPMYQQIFVNKRIPPDFPLQHIVDPRQGVKVEPPKDGSFVTGQMIYTLYDEEGNVIADDKELKGNKGWTQYFSAFSSNMAIILSDIPSAERMNNMFAQEELDAEKAPEEETQQK